MKGDSADDSKWTGDMGECKVCGGEIPHGHTYTCVIHKYQKELAELRDSIPISTNRTRERARLMLGRVSRHSDGPNGASHGCVEVTAAIAAVDSLVAQLETALDKGTDSDQELEKLTTGYTVLRDLVKDVQLVVDLDVDWEKFPETCLSLCHQDNVRLRQALSAANKDLKEMLLPLLKDFPQVEAIVTNYIREYSKLTGEDLCPMPESKK